MGYKPQLLSAYLGTHTNYSDISLTGSRRAAAWSSSTLRNKDIFFMGSFLLHLKSFRLKLSWLFSFSGGNICALYEDMRLICIVIILNTLECTHYGESCFLTTWLDGGDDVSKLIHPAKILAFVTFFGS